MTELSDNAKQLAETLCGSDYEMADGGIRGGIDHAADGHHFLHKYDTAALLEIASAALELAGEKVEYEDRGGERYRARWYKSVGIEVFQVDHDAPTIEINGQRPGLKDIVRFVDALLHAARTAREWASEGGES